MAPPMTVEAMEEILVKMETGAVKVDESGGSVVKLQKAETELLKAMEAARDFMLALLSFESSARKVLQSIFGGDCTRISRVRAVLETVTFSPMFAGDQRIPLCLSACESVEKVLNDMGLGMALKRAQETEKLNLRRRMSSSGHDTALAARLASAAHEAQQVEAVPPPEECIIQETVLEAAPAAAPAPEETPEEKPAEAAAEEELPVPKAPTPLKSSKLAVPGVSAGRSASPRGRGGSKSPRGSPRSPRGVVVDEELVGRILAVSEPAELVSLEPPKEEKLPSWMIWMVHRAHLNDPSLERFDFTNLRMPTGKEEARIAPKLVAAMERNTCISSLILANSNLQPSDGITLGNSLKSNKVLRVLNVDSNFLSSQELSALAEGAAQCPSLEELRANNQHTGPPTPVVLEAFSSMLKTNNSIVKLGIAITDPHFRNDIDKSVMRNNDMARQRRVEAKRAAQA